MSLGGFRKQLNKTSQFLGEKVVGNKGSEIDKEIIEMCQKLDVVNEYIEEVRNKTKEYLQPNPAARTKMAMQSSYQKARGQLNTAKYPQPEYNLGEILHNYGDGLNNKSPYSTSLTALGNSFNALSDAKDNMEMQVTEGFVDALNEIQQTDLKEISHHRKKLRGRRLDYDYKRNKGEKVAVEDLQSAKDKFVESQELCYSSMSAFLENDARHIELLQFFTNSVLDYHKRCVNILEAASDTLSRKIEEANNPSHDEIPYDSYSSTGSDMLSEAETLSTVIETASTPCCRALYDFEGEGEGDLSFKQGDMILLSSRIDDFWLAGSTNGKNGVFPENYVEILVPLLIS